MSMDDDWDDTPKAKKPKLGDKKDTGAKSKVKAKPKEMDDEADDWGSSGDPKTSGKDEDNGDWGEAVEAGDWDMDDDKNGAEGDMDASEDKDAPALSRTHSFTVLTPEKLSEKQEQLVKQVAEFLYVEPAEAGCLLRHFGWKEEKLKKAWLDDAEKVRKDVGLTLIKPDEKKLPTEVQCDTAYCDLVPVSQATRLNCGHWFCNTCWEAYLTSQINHGQGCVFTVCPGLRCKLNHNHKFGCACNEKVPEALFKRFIKDEALISKYHRWMLNSFVEGQRNIRWCPKPNCQNAVMYPTGGTKAIQCKCGHRFCFSCNELAHTPSPCDLVKRWLAREKSDDATEIWLAARTKECPKCSVRIEKNKACNHMTCAKCGHHFCWLCKGPWASHGSSTGGYYVCNKYDQDMAKGQVSEEENKILTNTKLLQKYTYYYKRFKGMADGIEMTKKLGAKLETAFKDDDIAKFGFLMDAVDKLIQARQILMWTYCMSFYMRAGGSKQLFEYQQDMLVGNTEALQDIMENNAAEKLLDMRKEVLNRTSSIDKFRQEMVKQVERGDFEELLMSKEDAESESWGCSTCKKDNAKDAVHCASCGACKLHGEMECKPCKKLEKKPAAPGAAH